MTTPEYEDIYLADYGQRLVAYVLDTILFWVTLFIGWFIWAFIVFGNGQTPGKQIVGIRAVKSDLRPCSWGDMFVREILIKGILIDVFVALIFFPGYLIAYLWPLWDDNRQALHDKMIQTVVISDKPRRGPIEGINVPRATGYTDREGRYTYPGR